MEDNINYNLSICFTSLANIQTSQENFYDNIDFLKQII